ncbi:phage tail-collar fiber domain-containing protein [Campylobacter sp. RM12637]|uniref:phage tail-collar fiber domain-containing protein n=1 Tax=Campylobacter sp. RM12637 TaxID=2735734 RepID=UPI0030146F5A|nr:phage tail protein [Campylobacter sp. RM12637]
MYETLITKKGQELLAKALSTNTQVALKEIRFSDYAGSINENMNVLASIKHTQDITSNMQDTNNANTIVIETLIPANIGGFYIETLGVYTNKGELFALAKINSTYKPLLSENLATDLHVKLYLQVGNATNVVLNIDESVVLASREYVNAELLLIKDEFNKSQNLQDNKISALENTKAEKLQVFTRDEINVKLNTKADKTTTYTKVEVDNSQTTQNTTISTNHTSVLNQLALQNTQMSKLMTQCQNLLTKIELGGGKVGMIFMYAGATIPSNYMLCDGRELLKTAYPQLFQAIGTIYGESTDKLKFKIPDLRGKFVRCVGGNAFALGVLQGDAIRNIKGDMKAAKESWGNAQFIDALDCTGVFEVIKGNKSWTGDSQPNANQAWGVSFDVSRVVPTANENRPINMAMNFIIQLKE